MAKKKMTTTHGNPTKEQEQQLGVPMAMDDSSMEKLQSLKDLNSILLKQTVELRQQVDSLKQSNVSLEMELTRSKSDMDDLRSELIQLNERTVELEVERSVVVVFAGELGEVIEKEKDVFKKEKFEIEGKLEGLERKLLEISAERDENESVAMCKIAVQISELNAMRERLIEAENREKVVSEDFEKLKAEYDSSIEEKEEMGRKIEEILSDKNSLEKSLIDYDKEITEIKAEIERIGREKEEIKQERDLELMKRSELENEVSELNVTISNLRNEEEKLRVYVSELEVKCSEGSEQGKEMQRHLDELVKEKNEMEVKLQSLIDGKSLVDKDLNEALKTIDDYKQKMEEMADKNCMIGEDNVKKESEINELEKQVVGLRNVVSSIEKSCSDQEEEIKNLVSELDHYKDAFELIKSEKNETTMALDKEKQNGLSLKQRIAEIENNINGNLQLIKKIKAENSNITNKKEELGRHFSELKNEIAIREKECVDANNELSVMSAKAELAESRSLLVLNALRSTAEFVSSKDENIVPNGSYLDHDIEMYVVEMEAIKNAFRAKENKVNDMSKQLELLEYSMAAAHKKKSLLTMVSSVTSLFAAISLAYLARGR